MKSGGLDLLLVPPRVEASLWRRLRFERDVRCREQLFTRYRSLANLLAKRQFRTRPRHGIEIGDIEQFAYAGLLQAIDGFDPLRGIPFSAFARRRILGSISDGAGRMNELDAQYSYRRRVETERARSIADSATEGNDDPLGELSRLVSGLALGLMLEETSLLSAPDGRDYRPNAYESLAWRQMHALIAQQIARLPDREETIIRQHYENGVSFAQIAQLLGLSKGRVSQLHAAALAKLRANLGKIR